MSPVTPEDIRAEIEQRLGYFPPFFAAAVEVPPVLANLWQQTLAAYLDSPIPLLFKEKLFALLSRVSASSYCLVTHACALGSLGMPAKDVAALLQSTVPRDQRFLEAGLAALRAARAPLLGYPEPGSALETSLLRSAALWFLYPGQSDRCRTELHRLLGPVNFAHLVVFLGYVRTCQAWAEAHPGMSAEADRSVEENLASLLAGDPRLARLLGVSPGPASAGADSAPGQGAATPAGGAQERVDLRGVRVLIVDGDLRVRGLLKSTLSAWGAEVTEAQSQAQGIAAIGQARGAGRGFQLVLVECRAPGMKGFDFAEHLSGDAETLASTLVLLPPGYWNGDPARVRQLGMAGSVVKPIANDDLTAGIAAALGRSPRTPETVSSERPPEPSPDEFPEPPSDQPRIRVLAVDDSQDGRALIHWCLGGGPYQVEFARDGGTAVDMFRAGTYDLVIMDIQMPHMDGYAATQAIRDWERKNSAKPTPIIAVTAYTAIEDAQKCLRAGCMAYLAKPITKEQLRRAVEKQIVSWGRHPPPAPPTPAPRSAETSRPEDPSRAGP